MGCPSGSCVHQNVTEQMQTAQKKNKKTGDRNTRQEFTTHAAKDVDFSVCVPISSSYILQFHKF